MTTQLAYNSDPARKAAILAAMRADIAADRLVKGQYWQDGKGCAIGCLVRGSSHDDAAALVRMPVELAGLFDAIFEGLPNGEAMAWPVQFLDAIEPGADLSLVWPRWAHWLLREEVSAVAAHDPACAKTVADVATLFAEWIGGVCPKTEAWKMAAGAAWAARAAAAGAAAAGAAAAGAVGAAGAAAEAAAGAAKASGAAAGASGAAAGAASYGRQRDKLIDLLSAATASTTTTS